MQDLEMKGEDFNNKMMRILGDIIKNNLPFPYSKDSEEGQEAWIVAEEALKFASNGKIKLAISYMAIALRAGVPEPVNTHLRSLIKKLIDRQIKNNIQYNKLNKHLLKKVNA